MLILTLLAVMIAALRVSAAHAANGAFNETGAGPLQTRMPVIMVCVVTFAVLWYSWGAMTPMPVVHDEISYVLQSRIFAQGHWSLPSPPIPLFWEQPHVLTEPRLASKYFPGHAILLSLGVLVGWVPLMPLLLQGIAASLVFVLARRVSNGAVALLTWVVWLVSPMVLYFGPAYYSEATTIVCWLGGWYALLRWHETGQARWMILLAILVAYGEVTRPLTGVAFAIPVAIVVVRDVVRRQAWAGAAAALCAGLCVLAILPIWSRYTTGDWTLTPLALYTRSYMPYDVPGFGLIRTPPTHSITPDLAQWNAVYSSAHTNHLVANLLPILASRAMYLGVSIFGSTSGILLVFAVLGLAVLRKEAAFALAGAVTLVVTYLLFGTPAQWTLYYYEAVPTFAFLAACGFAWCASLAGPALGGAVPETFAWWSRRWARSLIIAAAILGVAGLIPLQMIRRQHIGDRSALARFDALVSTIHDSKAILFIRYSPLHSPHVALVRNTAHLDDERVWLVYDRGDVENARLLALAPGRRSYLFDEAQGRTYEYP